MRQGIARFWHDQAGATALEFALISIPLLMFTFGITELGRAVFMQQSLSHAVDTAARGLYLDPDRTAATIKADILSNLFLAVPAQLDVLVGPVTDAPGTDSFRTIRLEVDYEFRSVIPDWITDRIPLNFERTVIVEG